MVKNKKMMNTLKKMVLAAGMGLCTLILEAQDNDWRISSIDSAYWRIVEHDSVSLYHRLMFGDRITKFSINDYVINATRTVHVYDSIRFMKLLDLLLSGENRKDRESIARALDKLRYIKLLKKHSNEIVQKLGGIYKKNHAYSRLLSLINPPDSIRFELMENSTCTLCKARLGDSTAIAYYLNDYIAQRDRKDSDFRNDEMTYYLNILFSLDSKEVLDVIFNDVQSSRIITRCDRPDKQENCFLINYTYLYSIIEVLMMKHLDEPLLLRTFIHALVKVAYPKESEITPLLHGFFISLENFILREYGYSVKINVPFVIAEEPD